MDIAYGVQFIPLSSFGFLDYKSEYNLYKCDQVKGFVGVLAKALKAKAVWAGKNLYCPNS